MEKIIFVPDEVPRISVLELDASIQASIFNSIILVKVKDEIIGSIQELENGSWQLQTLFEKFTHSSLKELIKKHSKYVFIYITVED